MFAHFGRHLGSQNEAFGRLLKIFSSKNVSCVKMWILARRVDEKLIFKGQGLQKLMDVDQKSLFFRHKKVSCVFEEVLVDFGAHLGSLLGRFLEPKWT